MSDTDFRSITSGVWGFHLNNTAEKIWDIDQFDDHAEWDEKTARWYDARAVPLDDTGIANGNAPLRTIKKQK